MKFKATLFFIACLSACSLAGFSQDTVHLKKRYMNERIIVTDRAPQAVYGELWGKGVFFSGNYDRRFSKRLDGLGFSAGIGYMKIDDVSLVSIPVGINYLAGRNGKYFEVGAGATYLSADVLDIDNVNAHGSTVMGTMTIGYRSQPVNGGFMFRAGLNPILLKDNFIPYWPYVSFGYCF
ncbi:MAG: hypothetical protein JST39_11210 [Bacteroidetes bacterium]|nr:hypothetical protein [Bacteroidota bacterium]